MVHRTRRSARYALLSLFLCLSAPAWAELTAPNGIVTPRRGPYAGQVCKFGDGSAEYTRIAEFTVAELESFISGKRQPPPGMRGEVSAFILSMQNHDYDFHSQLAKEGYKRYKELVRACLEDGRVAAKGGWCEHRAPLPIGISILTGKAVAEYTLRTTHFGYWVVEPGWWKE